MMVRIVTIIAIIMKSRSRPKWAAADWGEYGPWIEMFRNARRWVS